MRRNLLLAYPLVAAAAASACGGAGTDSSGDDLPTISVSTDILGDVVANLVGDLASVEVIVPSGMSPHEFQPSARQVAALRDADAVVVNGAGFEEGLLPSIDAVEADGVPTIVAIEAIPPLDSDDDGHDDDGRDDSEGHEHDGLDPHFFTDPARTADAAEAVADRLADEVPDIDRAILRRNAGAYVEELRALDAEVEELLATVPSERRKLVTNHEVFGYFADRYDFEVIGAVIPAGTTQAEPSAGELNRLAATVAAEGVPAIFVETSSPTRLAETLAAEVGDDIAVVELYSESLGDEGAGADTYAGAVRTNAERIADALDD
jgi:zinc/manganese transport system substrate-binding protein